MRTWQIPLLSKAVISDEDPATIVRNSVNFAFMVILLIARANREHLSLHGDDRAALDALARYVDDHWADAHLPADAVHEDTGMRVDAWFRATQALYVIADASIEEQRT